MSLLDLVWVDFGVQKTAGDNPCGSMDGLPKRGVKALRTQTVVPSARAFAAPRAYSILEARHLIKLFRQKYQPLSKRFADRSAVLLYRYFGISTRERSV
jgi:hypothetical protein